MEPLIARAFLTLLLTPDQIAELKCIENGLPHGRYLQGFEICRYFALKPDPLDEFREKQMLNLLWEWRKENAISNREDNIHDWMDFVASKWVEPLSMKLGGTVLLLAIGILCQGVVS